MASPHNLGQSSNHQNSSSSSGRHTHFHGIRQRNGKWVSEIREPRSTTRIWLGTYLTPEMAAVAYDVAALSIKGPSTPLNFPDKILSYPVPASKSGVDIRAAAALAAEAQFSAAEKTKSGSSKGTRQEEYIDEDELLNMPNVLADMAEGMLLSPPKLHIAPSGDSPENSHQGGSLWTYQ